jgi:hypothetical protein
MKTKHLFIIAVLATALQPAALRADETKSSWRTAAQLNLYFAGLSGDATVKGFPANVDQSFRDIASNLKAALAGKITVANDKWSLATEFSYMKLGAANSAVSVDVKQWLVEPSVGYKVSDGVVAFAGGRYNSIDVTATASGPAGIAKNDRKDWWTPIIGVQFNMPITAHSLTFVGHFDVGSTGSSNSTWQVFPYLNWHISERSSAQAGYRWLNTDYETGSGSSKFAYNMLAQGPQLGFSYQF